MENNDYLTDAGLDRLLKDVMAHEPPHTAMWQYRNDPIFHAVVKHILETTRDGRFTLQQWWQALELAQAFSGPLTPEPPQPPAGTETARKTAPVPRQMGEELEQDGERWDGQS